ncbi:hypothetical protein MGSAQ_001138 [marine sediment metagenome]|uniref:Uncharacterized protein n=1 Tax=marine sediment metagenome TaxID=412755 RepID=A0A1B6NV82_9ZZZZ
MARPSDLKKYQVRQTSTIFVNMLGTRSFQPRQQA